MPRLIDEYRAKLVKEEELERKHDEKRQALLEEARDFYGYDVDPRDPRYEYMRQMKEEEEKKLKKQKKKEAKLTWLDIMKKQWLSEVVIVEKLCKISKVCQKKTFLTGSVMQKVLPAPNFVIYKYIDIYI